MTGAVGQAAFAPPAALLGVVMATGLATAVALTLIAPQGLQVALPLLAAAAFAAAVAADKRGWRHVGVTAKAPLAVVAALAAWPVLVTLWSPDPWDALRKVGSFALMAFFAALTVSLVRLARPHARIPPWAGASAGLGIALPFLLMLTDLLTGGGASSWFWDETWMPYRHNRPIAVGVAFMWYAAFLVGRHGGRWPAMGLVALAGFCALMSESAASQLAWIVGVVVWLLCRGLSNARRVIASAIVAGSVGMPILVAVITAASVSSLAPGLASFDRASFGVRLDVWAASLDLIEPWGRGVRYLRSVEVPAIADVFTDARINHPHNAWLQVPLDLGVPGSVMLFIGLAILARAAAWGRLAAFHLASLAGAATIAAVSWDLWATWWIAALGLLVAVGVWLDSQTDGRSSDRS